MIGSLHGIVAKPGLHEACIVVGGVGYRLKTSAATWDALREGEERTVWISTVVREDRFDLYAFLDHDTRTLFEELIERQGIGPKLGLELSSVPRSLLLQAVEDDDGSLLASIKGVGKKTAEKTVIELRGIMEKHPHLFAAHRSAERATGAVDNDALAALLQLGYARSEALEALSSVPKETVSTSDRVSAALRSL